MQGNCRILIIYVVYKQRITFRSEKLSESYLFYLIQKFKYMQK